MGMKLKSGADLCGFELSRFCVQNDVAIPDAPASGRKYFHTGTGMEGKYSLLGRERIFTGTSWRAAAYVDDLANLDLATNADYLALKEKVELLSGEVDTDAIINNMKEVSNFLAGFAEDAKLMDVLSNVPKALFTNDRNPLDYTSRPLFITAFRTNEGTSADYGTLIVPTWSGNSAEKYYLSELRFTLGVAPQFRTSFNGEASDWKTIAFTDSNVASATKLQAARTIWGQSFDGTGNVSGNLNLNLARLIWHGEESYSISCPNTATAAKLLYQAFDGHQFECAGGIAMLINSSGNVTIGPSSTPNGRLKIVGEDTSASTPALYISNSSGDPLLDVRNNGNVGIGTPDPQYKLHVAGDIATDKYLRILAWPGYGEGSCDMWFDGTTSNLKMGSRLHVAYDIQADGNIVANGTIACKGVAAEGSAPVGTVDKWAGSIATGTKSQTYTHGLGTTDITVAIYEKNGNEWVQILTDVDIVNANTIRVTFGANTTVEHRIVVMG